MLISLRCLLSELLLFSFLRIYLILGLILLQGRLVYLLNIMRDPLLNRLVSYQQSRRNLHLKNPVLRRLKLPCPNPYQTLLNVLLVYNDKLYRYDTSHT